MSSSSNALSKLLGRLTRRRPPGDAPPESVEAVPFSDRPPGDHPVETTNGNGHGPESEGHEHKRSDEASTPSPSAASDTTGPGIATGHALLRLIGKGAYGEVWLGRDELGNYHAVKLVRKDRFSDKAPFEREYRGLLQYTPISRTHHGLVHILNVGRDNNAGLFFYVMELADCVHTGREIVPDRYEPHTLEQSFHAHGALPLGDCLRLGIELCEGLNYLHSRQLIHRDIKPPNIVFVNGLAKLADVGLITHIAEARRDPKQLGTEGFIPPEGPGTPLADVYSLGKVLTEAAFGATTLPALEGISDPALRRFGEIMAHACHDEVDNRSASPMALQAELMELSEAMQSGGNGAMI
jgi:serine/threonine protein kinase